MVEVSDSLIAKLDDLVAQFDALQAQLADPVVLSNHEKIRDLSIKRTAIADIVERYGRFRRLQAQISEGQKIIEEGEDAELMVLAKAEAPQLRSETEQLMDQIAAELVTADDAIVGSVILEIRAASGGDEAALWAGDLYSMYEKFASSQRWKMEPFEFAQGDMGGLRHATMALKGEAVWQQLGYEGGVHCVKRVPATESQGRVHTSTATVAVLPEPAALQIDIPDCDVQVHVTTAQGPGGQNVNKVSTAVHMIHKPTGIDVRMQETKSQHQNREKAWQLLRARVFDHYQRQSEAERAADRSSMIGTGGRSERIRTYRFKDSIVVDHRLGRSFNLQAVLMGQMDELVQALVAQDTAQRLAAL